MTFAPVPQQNRYCPACLRTTAFLVLDDCEVCGTCCYRMERVAVTG